MPSVNIDNILPGNLVMHSHPSTDVTGLITAKRSTTLIVAASNSQDITRADYVCTGTSDQTTINTAISALPAGGGKVVLLEGTYSTSGTINVALSNTTLEGQGVSTIISLANAGNADVITVGAGATAYSNITIKNLKINGNMTNQTTGGHGIVIGSGLTRPIIDSCWIINTYNGNITDNGSLRAVFKNNYLDTTRSGCGWSNIESSGSQAIIVDNFCNAGDYSNIAIYGGSQTYMGGMIRGNICMGSRKRAIENSNWNNIISQNYIQTFTSDGIWSSYPSNISGNNVFISNNPTGNAITTTLSDPQIITDNVIILFGNHSSAMTVIYDAVQSSIVSGNQINNEVYTADIGIVVNSQYYCTVSSNVLNWFNFTTGSVGINIGAGQYNTVSGNVTYSIETGVVCSGGASTICNNLINSATTAFVLTGAIEITVSGNALDLTDQAVVAVNTARKDGLVINGNVFTNSNAHGVASMIDLKGVGYSIISSNRIRCTNTNGILLQSTGTAYSINNVITGNIINAGTNGIKENSANEGPSIITSNIVTAGAGTQIVTAHTGTDVSHNITH